MRTLFLIIVYFFVNCCAIAQNRNNIWCFGDSAGIDFNNLSNPATFSTGMDGRGDCTSIADINGNLLFYAAGLPNLQARIYDANHNAMPNSDSIPGAGYYGGMLIIQKPGSDSLYYLFYRGNPSNVDTFYYALIDMSLNGGLGAVIKKNIPIQHINFADCMTAIKHGNGRDWWLIDKLYTLPFTNFNRFYTYLITPDSIYQPLVQNFNDAKDIGFQKIIWHPTYQKFMVVNTRGYMAEFDFDRCNGLITLNRTIFAEQLNNFDRIFFDGTYSPNGGVFYVSRNTYANTAGNKNYLLQYDLTAASIPNSCDTLDSTLYPPADCGAVRLAPDGKIYYTQKYTSSNAIDYPYQDSMRYYINENLGVINNPDVVGSGCNFAPFSFYLGGKRTYYGLPNNPNYELGALVGSPCDTLSVGIEELEIKTNAELFVFYHSTWQQLFVNAKNIKGKNGVLKIVDMQGKVVYCASTSLSMTLGGYFTMDVNCAAFAKGMYVVSLTTEKEWLVRKFVKE